MRLREWVRRGRITTPPEVIPLVVVGIVAMLVAHLALSVIGAVVAIVYALFTEPEILWDEEVLPAYAVLAAAGGLLVGGWRLVRRLVAGWFRRQPPDPPPSGPMNG
jgi:hypothetical protein